MLIAKPKKREIRVVDVYAKVANEKFYLILLSTSPPQTPVSTPLPIGRTSGYCSYD